MSNQFSPGLMMVPYLMDRVELRRGVWNTESTILEDDEATGTLWPTLDLLSQGAEHSEILSRVPGLTRTALEDVVTQLTALGALISPDQDTSDGWQPRPVWVVSDDTDLADLTRQFLVDEGLDVTVVSDDTKPPASFFTGLRLDQSADELLMEEQALEIVSTMHPAAQPQPVLVVVLAQNNPAMLRALDLLARRAGLAWLHAVIDGPALYVGPFIIPGLTASYRTFEQRVSMNLRERQGYLSWMRSAADQVQAGRPEVAVSTRALLAAHVAHETTSIARRGLSTTRNKVLSIYLPTMEIAFNDVLPMAKFDGTSQFAAASDLYYDIREWISEGGR